jgi:hypothetical protein
MTAVALIARAQAAGVRMRLEADGAVMLEADRPPPPDLLADLEEHRDAIRAALLADALPPTVPPDPATLPPAWLAAMRRRAEAGRARVERHYGVDVAVFELTADEPDDAPGTIASALPTAIRIAQAAALAAPPAEAGPHLRDEAAEREAIRRQGNWRPPAWAETEEAPRPGDWCGGCRGQRWWRPARPRTDGLAPGPGWRCAVCRPVPPGCETAEARQAAR